MENISSTLHTGHLAGNGEFTKKCVLEFSKRYRFKNNYLTTSCTDALEMAAILANISSGDEVIMPSYTFPSTANAFVLRGANIVFIDSYKDHPNMNHSLLEASITSKTKAIVPVHYAGVACEMNAIREIARTNKLLIIEDAAQALDAYYYDEPLGGIGDFGAFSFHETKNISCGEGGMIVVNNKAFAERAEVIIEKGTNKSAFSRGEVDKYSWVDIGSSFLSSEILAAFLSAQLDVLDQIQGKRKRIWNHYFDQLSPLESYGYRCPVIPDFATKNGHIFYLICPTPEKRTQLIQFLKNMEIQAYFHYQPLHRSKFYKKQNATIKELPNSVKFGECLIRLPLYPDLSETDQAFVIEKVKEFVTIT